MNTQSGELAIDLRALNRTVRHRVRNVCAGMSLALDQLEAVIPATDTGSHDLLEAMRQELAGWLSFSHRLDLLIEPLPPPSPIALESCLANLVRYGREQRPEVQWGLDNQAGNPLLPHGSWWLTMAMELVDNALQAQLPGGGHLQVDVRPGPPLALTISNPVSRPTRGWKAPEKGVPGPGRGGQDGFGLGIIWSFATAVGGTLALKAADDQFTATVTWPDLWPAPWSDS